jgi:FKBP-type peptidyl-prolyl cis-trans isomerase FklB
MKKSILWLVSVLFLLPLTITSCEENDGLVNPYGDWKNRNQLYIDSIAEVAYANPDEWKIIHTYQFPEPTDPLASKFVKDYVYCKVLESGDGISPFYIDTVSANYRGQLIPLLEGTVVTFDQSYQGELNKDVAIPRSFALNGVIPGWTTALQHMREGDYWKVYIPSELGYGLVGSDNIPGYSTLCFDIHLVKVTSNR